MNKNKILANTLCASMIVGNITPAFATVTNETSTFDDSTESAIKQTEVLYQKAGNYFVTIPKTISLGSDKQSPYSVKVEGDIPSDKQVYVSPIDSIKDTENLDFYMHDTNTANPKDDVVATVTQNKFYWNFSEVANGYIETNNKVTALDLTSGTWKGTFDFEINMKALNGDESHTHSYTETITQKPTCTEDGEKTLTCSCGDTKTESIPATGHNIEDGSCTECDVIVKTIDDLLAGDTSFDMGTVLAVKKSDTLKVNDTVIPEQNFTFDKEGDYKVTIESTDPDTKAPIIININITIIINQQTHIHNYTETIIKKATCTEVGEKKLTCSCGDSKTETIPATGHSYGADDKCTNCGELNPNHKHNYTETIIKEATCTESGEKKFVCSCGDSKTESILATGHDYEDGTCKNCGETEQCKHNYVSKTFNLDWVRDSDGTSGYSWVYESGSTNSTRYKSNEPTGVVMQGDIGAAITTWKITVPVSCSAQIGFKPQSTTGNAHTFIYLNDNEIWKNTDISNNQYNYKTITLQKGDNYLKAKGYYGDRIELFKVTGEYLQCTNCSDILGNNWRYMLDETNKTITLRSYRGSDLEVIVPASFSINGLDYKTIIGSSPSSLSVWSSTADYMFMNNKNIKSVRFEKNVDLSDVTSDAIRLNAMFCNCTSLEKVEFDNVNVNNVTRMDYMFYNCASLKKVDLTGIDTSSVINMESMFAKCTSLTELVLSNLDTSSVTNMSSMFMDCSSLEELDLGNFNTSNVTDMSHMFRRCYLLNDIYVTQDKWFTDQATSTNMFTDCGTSSVTYK